MSELTQQQVVEAARKLDKDEFTRDDLAEQLGIRRREMKEAFRAAWKSGELVKVGADDEGTAYFRLTNE